MRSIISSLLLFLSLSSFAQNPVILISIDGFAYDYLDKFKPKNIMSLAENGVYANRMMPVFPSKTFPNHLSIVTGVYPVEHGIVHNQFFNREINEQYTLGAGKDNSDWLTAKPIWTIAEQKGLRSAIYFWPESQTTVEGVLPSHYFPYKHNTPNIQRIDQVVKWLKLPNDQRPHLIVSYFSTVDSAGHTFGINSKELKIAINDIDKNIGHLIARIAKETSLTPNIILVSDHGMTPIKRSSSINVSSLQPLSQLTRVINGQTQLYIYEDNINKLNDVRSQLLKNELDDSLEIFVKGDYPVHWHFNEDSNVVPDMIINALPPTTFVDKRAYKGKATHGYDAINNLNLAAIFIANGPNIKKNLKIDSFENIHVFSLLEKLLALPISTQVNSKLSVLENIMISKNKSDNKL